MASGHARSHLLHEAIHLVEQLGEIAIAMDVYMKGIEAIGFAIAPQVFYHLRGGSLTRGQFRAGRRRIARDGAEFHAKAHSRLWRRHAPDLLTGLAQCGLTRDQIGQG